MCPHAELPPAAVTMSFLCVGCGSNATTNLNAAVDSAGGAAGSGNFSWSVSTIDGSGNGTCVNYTNQKVSAEQEK